MDKNNFRDKLWKVCCEKCTGKSLDVMYIFDADSADYYKSSFQLLSSFWCHQDYNKQNKNYKKKEKKNYQRKHVMCVQHKNGLYFLIL